MKHLFIISLFSIFSLISMAEGNTTPKRYAIKDTSIPKDSVEEFASKVLMNARKEQYDKIKPHFSWTWNKFYGTWGPEYPWKSIHKAKSENDIYHLRS